MTDLLTMSARPPRVEWVYSDPHSRFKCIGLLIDWLDSRPEHTAKDAEILIRQAWPGDEVAYAVALITGRVKGFWMPNEHCMFPTDYRVYFHDCIAGNLHADEVAFGEHTYRRLHEVMPDCMSAIVNLAELERRAGRETVAMDLLHKALNRAESTDAARYGIADSTWELSVRCALARLAREIGERKPLLENARRDQLNQLVEQLKRYDSAAKAAIAANQAFSVASVEQRILLGAALRLAFIPPLPPPAAHGDFAATLAVDELVRQHKAKQPTQTRSLFGPPLRVDAKLEEVPFWQSILKAPVMILAYCLIIVVMFAEGTVTFARKLLPHSKTNHAAEAKPWVAPSTPTEPYERTEGISWTVWAGAILWLLIVGLVGRYCLSSSQPHRRASALHAVAEVAAGIIPTKATPHVLGARATTKHRIEAEPQVRVLTNEGHRD